MEEKKELAVFQTNSGAIEVRTDAKNATVWLTQADLSAIFEKDQSVISRHIKSIFKDGELEDKSNMQKMHIANSDKPVTFYSLDIVLAVGYRTNSSKAINFRKWATKILKQHITQGYTVNLETPTIFDITKERLIRASKKIQEENLALSEAERKDLSNQDLGFKIFETMLIWEDYNFESKELEKQSSLFDESKLTKEDIKALLITWKTYDGISLTETIQERDLNGYTAHYSSEKLYLMDKGLTTENLKAVLEKIDSDKNFNSTTIIAFGYHFESKSLREISENIKSYANKKSIDIDFVGRV